MKKKKVSFKTLEVKKETIVVLGGGASPVVAGLARTTTGCFTKRPCVTVPHPVIAFRLKTVLNVFSGSPVDRRS
jgi:hypothetical protein